MPQTRNGSKAKHEKPHDSDSQDENEFQVNKATSRHKRKAEQISKDESSDDEHVSKTLNPSRSRRNAKRVKQHEDDNSSGIYTNTRYSKNPPGGGKPISG